DSNGDAHAFLYEAGLMNDLGTLGGTTSTAAAINAGGLIAGYGQITGDTGTHPFLYSGGVMTDLGTLGGDSDFLVALNAAGQGVGMSFLPGAAFPVGLFWDGGALRDLNALIDPASGWTIRGATDINDAGWIVGYGNDGGIDTRALLLVPLAAIPEPDLLTLIGAGAWLLGRRRRETT
ncbi:MAG TPA: HAF repeat/PEP-CTERM domain-containing protein, partial [Plasticicumulans sp.]|nr:HAF repeat/PEP-CTERM domain-containing protein [Plasticicumulans sp.]